MPDARTGEIQFGQDTAWKTPPTNPLLVLPIISETLTAGVEFRENNAKTGSAGAGKMIKTGIKPNGGIETRITPEEAGYYLGNCLGLEPAAPESIIGSIGGYRHTFVPVKWGPGIRMSSFSLIKNNGKFEYQRIISNQVATWSLTLNPEELATFSLTVMGYDEVKSTVVAEYPNFQFDDLLVAPILEPYKTCKGVLKIDDVVFGEIDTFTIGCDNRLTDRGQGLNGDCRRRENEAGSRLVTASFTAKLDAASATMREDKYKAGAEVSINLVLVGPEYEAGYNYEMEFDLPGAKLLTYDAFIPADGQIVVSATAQAHEVPGNDLIYAYHNDTQAAKYIP